MTPLEWLAVASVAVIVLCVGGLIGLAVDTVMATRRVLRRSRMLRQECGQ